MGLFAIKNLYLVIMAILAALTALAAVAGLRRRLRLRNWLPTPPDGRSQATAERLATGCIIAAVAALPAAAWFSRPSAVAPEPDTAVFFLLDCSASMLAESHSASRLHEAKTIITGMQADLPELPVALVTFAGNAMLDFPPSRDHDNFRLALAAVKPQPGFIAGSAPSAALRLAEDTARAIKARPVLILLSDGEINSADMAREDALWANRQAPALIAVTGIPGTPKPIPANNGWVMDPDTGTAGLSTTTDRELLRLARLSPAHWRLADHTSPTSIRRQLRQLLASAQAGSTAQRRLNHARTALLGALIMLTAWMALKRGLFRRTRPPSSHHPALVAIAVPMALSVTLMTTAATAQPAVTAMPPAADHQRLADDIRKELLQDDVPAAERARLLANWAALLLCREPPGQTDQPQARQDAAEAVALCREALRLRPGYQPAITNLTVARQRLENPPAPPDMSGMTTAQPGQQAPHTTGTPEKTKPHTAPDNQASATPPGVNSATESHPAAESTPAAAEANSRHAPGGTWRDLQTRQRSIPARPPGVKPW